MRLRAMLALLLILTFVPMAPAHQQEQRDDTAQEQTEGEKITPEEEREAREIAALFSTRWEETGDIGPLVKEFYVHDFADRLRTEPEMLILGELDEKLLVAETRDELQRHYIASTNLIHLFFKFYQTSWPMQSAEGDGVDTKLLPAGVLQVFRSNPTLSAIMAEELDEEEAGSENGQLSSDGQPDDKKVKSIEQLKSLTDALEQAALLLRDYLRNLPEMLQRSEIERQRKSESEADSEIQRADDDPVRPCAMVPGGSFYGYPEGTRFISVNILPFQMALVREGQRLKIVSFYPLTD